MEAHVVHYLIKPGAGAAFADTIRRQKDLLRRQPGFEDLKALRHRDETDSYYVIAYWRSRDDMLAGYGAAVASADWPEVPDSVNQEAPQCWPRLRVLVE